MKTQLSPGVSIRSQGISLYSILSNLQIWEGRLWYKCKYGHQTSPFINAAFMINQKLDLLSHTSDMHLKSLHVKNEVISRLWRRKKRVEGNKIKICERNYRTPESSDRERQEMTRACRESKQEERSKVETEKESVIHSNNQHSQ